MRPVLEARDLSLPRRLERTSLSLEPGSVTVLIGPNGSGKTSLLHAISGIGRPSGCSIVAGRDVAREPNARASLISYLPASRELIWPLSVRDLVGLSGASDSQVDEVLEELDLQTFAERRTDRLSTGERSRALIARALAPRPALLLLDEPTANLDPLWQIRLLEQIRADVQRRAAAALIAMHDLVAGARFADRLIVMHGGRIAADGMPSEVLASPVMATVFGVVPADGGWEPVVRTWEDRQSLP